MNRAVLVGMRLRVHPRGSHTTAFPSPDCRRILGSVETLETVNVLLPQILSTATTYVRQRILQRFAGGRKSEMRQASRRISFSARAMFAKSSQAEFRQTKRARGAKRKSDRLVRIPATLPSSQDRDIRHVFDNAIGASARAAISHTCSR